MESRHYTVFPPTEGDTNSYNNDDQILLEFIHQKEGWEIHQGLYKSITSLGV